MTAAPAAAELPVGKQEVIVYAAGTPSGGPGQVTAVRPDGSDPTEIAATGAPSLSGGELIAISIFFRPGGKAGLFLPSHDRITVSRSDGANDRHVDGATGSFAPGGRTLLYSTPSYSPAPGGSPFSPPADLFSTPLELSPSTNLTQSSAIDEGEPDWFGGGARIVFESNRDGPDYDVFAAAADGTGQVNLTPASGDDDLAPAASPDGSRIAFVRRPAGGGGSEIWTIAADGSASTQITNTPGRTEADPVFSPDGSRIAFAATENGSSRPDVYVISTDGSGETPLTAATADGGQKPDWGQLTVLPPAPTCNERLSNVVGTEGDDRLNTTNFPDLSVASSLGGDDRVTGGYQPETLCGNAGSDVLRGSFDDDTLVGGAGADVLKGGQGIDVCLGVGEKDRTTGCKVRG